MDIKKLIQFLITRFFSGILELRSHHKKASLFVAASFTCAIFFLEFNFENLKVDIFDGPRIHLSLKTQ